MILFDPSLRPEQSSLPNPRVPFHALPSARSLAAFLRKAQAAVRLPGQVSVLLTSDLEIRRLNRRFRGKNQATDVLSFPAEPGPEKLAGDLAIGLPTAGRQAAAQGHSLATEIKVLMLHGLLHLAGYDHETDEGAMARRERMLRARLRLPPGLIERTASPPHPRTARSGKARNAAAGAARSRNKAAPAKHSAPSPGSGSGCAQDDRSTMRRGAGGAP